MFYGRRYELDLLETHYKSQKCEMVVLYGRRRIGKTELIKKFLEKKHAYYFEALEDASASEQIDHFLAQLAEQLNAPKYAAASWNEVFSILTPLLQKNKVVLVFDEFPWMARKRTKLVSLLTYFWDTKWKANKNLMLVLCGSVAQFMVKHIIHSKALHNRKTLELKLDHLTITEIKEFFPRRNVREISQVAMTVGGIPKYLEIFDTAKSFKINLNKEFFTKDGFFINEFETLFKEQFKTIHYYENIVKTLARENMSLQDIAHGVSFSSGGSLRVYLRNLELAGFIEEMTSVSWKGFKTKTKKFRLKDPFLRFYFHFIEPNRQRILLNRNENLVDGIMENNWYSFYGQAFDWFVYSNLPTILKKLEIPLSDVLHYGPYFHQTSRGSKNNRNVQIDLMLIRKNKCISIIENKFSVEPVGSIIVDEVQEKIDGLSIPRDFSCEKILITASGVTRGVLASNFFNHILTLEDMFI